MPKDDYARARRRDVGRRVASQKRAERANKRERGRKVYEASTILEISERTKLWFGKHKGKPIMSVPRHYLMWIAFKAENAHNSTFRRLQVFLRERLSKTQAESNLTTTQCEINGSDVTPHPTADGRAPAGGLAAGGTGQ